MPAGRRAHSVLAAALYLVAAVVLTWPLTTVIDRELAWDLGDPMFNSWVLMWTSGQLLAFLRGDVSTLNALWHGNIFYPEPLTLAYSEHMIPQMLQALPILVATDNVVLAYNLLFLSTFVLSGLGVFLLVRELTGSAAAGFVAGLAFAFAPYRVSQYSHLQVLSAQWMPFALYGFRRYFDTGRRGPLIGGTVALILQNLSCGYYLLFFAPFVGLYVVYEMAARGRLRDWALWRAWLIAGALTLLVTFPFLKPYLNVRESGDVGVRSAEEIARFSADTHAFVTPAPAVRVWAERLPTFPKPEGDGFPGATILSLVLVALAAGITRTVIRVRRASVVALPPWRQVLVGAVAVLAIAHVIAALTFLTTGGLPIPKDGAWAVHRQAAGVLSRTLGLGLLLMVVSPGVRQFLRIAMQSAAGYFAAAALLAAVLALGAQITVTGQPIATGPYAWLVAYVPGFDGVRVPARYLMLVALFLACLAGYGAATIQRWRPRPGAWVIVAAGLLILVESWVAPFQTNVRLAAEGYEPTPRTLRVGRDLPPIYRALRDQEEPVILVEFPFAVPAWDLHAVFYAGYHRRPLVNGYSGFFPESHRRLSYVFSLIPSEPDAAWRALLGTRASHVLVHDDAFIPSQQGMISNWLRSQGAIEILNDGNDRLFRVR